MKPHFSLAVYCGSRPGLNPAWTEQARRVGHWIAQHGGQLVYGGGHNGLMGILADAALEAGGQVLGVIPQALVDKEFAHRGCTELRIVQTMHERKHIMAEKADAFLALPGGIGTLEEFFEVWTWRQLGYHNKPVGLLNHRGYYDSLLRFLEQSVAQQFMSSWQMGLIEVGDEPTTLLKSLVQAAGLSHSAGLDQI